MHFKQHATRPWPYVLPTARSERFTGYGYLFQGELPIDLMLTSILDRCFEKAMIILFYLPTINN